MPDTETDTGVNKEADAAADPDVITALVDGEGEKTQVATEDDKQPVPYERFKEVNDAKNEAIAAKEAAEAQTQSLTSQFEAMQQQNAQPQQQTQASFLKDKFGLESFDSPTVEHMEAWVAHIQQENAIATKQTNAVAQNQRFISGKKDFVEKVGVFTPTGFVYSDTFQKAMAADPDLAQSNFEGSLTIQAAYTAVKAFETQNELAVMKATAKEQKAQKEAALKTGPMSAAAVGGGGSVNRSINAGLDPNTPEGADGIVENFERMAQGDFDT